MILADSAIEGGGFDTLAAVLRIASRRSPILSAIAQRSGVGLVEITALAREEHKPSGSHCRIEMAEDEAFSVSV